MNTFLHHLWTRLRTSFWFVPGILVAFAGLAAYGALAIDREWAPNLPGFPDHAGPGTGEGVRSLLSTAASSVLTLAGLTFSATLVALTLTSSQFGSRIIRNFIRSLPNQLSMGVLLGNYVLCLIVLQSINNRGFLPQVAAMLAFVATLGSLATFIYFMHHIAISLQADRIVEQVHEELDQSLEAVFPDERPSDDEERDADDEKLDWEQIDSEQAVTTSTTGYVQAINVRGLVEAAARHGIRCRVLPRPGQFVTAGDEILALSQPSGEAEIDCAPEQFLKHVLLGRFRSPEQDFEFCLRQLVEIALRALSPGINDPFTAIICIDYLGAALAKVATRRLPVRIFADDESTPRVLVRPTVFADLLGAAFHQIRQTAGNRPAIAIRLLEALDRIAACAMVESQREAVLMHAEVVLEAGRSSSPADCDATAIQQAYEEVLDTIRKS